MADTSKAKTPRRDSTKSSSSTRSGGERAISPRKGDKESSRSERGDKDRDRSDKREKKESSHSSKPRSDKDRDRSDKSSGKPRSKDSAGGVLSPREKSSTSSGRADRNADAVVAAEAVTPAYKPEEEQDPATISLAQQKECLLLLLEARTLLHQMVRMRWEKEQREIEERQKKEQEERKKRGKLSVTEIQSVLKSQPDGEEGDWISAIQDLKKQLVIEIRRNHVLDRDLQKLDKRIGLLIKNRTSIELVLKGMEKKKKRKQGAEDEPVFDLKKDPRKLEYYQELFYMLQTEPRYLAKCVYLVQPQQMESFLETTILTLYGDAFSPREEFLILRLFQLAIKNEIAKIKSLSDFLKATSVVPKMVVTYNRRKQGHEYLRNTLGPLLKIVMEKTDLSLELHPLNIYQGMINEAEIRTGEKSTLERNISEDQAIANAQVKAIMKQRLNALREICQMFLDGVLNSMNNLPYGIRWICKQIKNLSTERFGETLDNDQVLKVTGYFVYYRFINLAVVSPDAFNVIEKALEPLMQKNLVVVGKVLQNLFNFRPFNKQERYMMALNSFIEQNKATVEHYFNSLVKVDEPEDYLQVNKYMELTQKTKPVILISLREICATHQLLLGNLDNLATEKDDPLKLILNDLGEAPPDIDESDDREIQLTLTNRFKVAVEEEDEIERMYAETKELIIPVLRSIPVENSIHRLHLTDVLESGIRYAGETNNKVLSSQINKILENIAKLEKVGRLSKTDRYESFVHDISLEVANRRIIREQQKKEIDRLTVTLMNLRKHQSFVNDQIAQYQEYLKQCRERHYQSAAKPSKKSKKGSDSKGVGPFKFTYKELAKQGVIVDSEVPAMSRKRTHFIISSEEVGMFDITAKIAGISVEKMNLELDDLLERHYNGVEYLELEQVTLDVNMTIHLINKFFLGGKK
eukprot:TRINITY_DN1266_c0_g1_i2.p1 TRINITY_DN1266_c0_g1~~TRINITY_DN1266_c0_g1_i2.p1  ORF type:complete len:921 (+),score=243.14 TRINITY_DN1266_c0_g1_i2:199-2961(+)